MVNAFRQNFVNYINFNRNQGNCSQSIEKNNTTFSDKLNKVSENNKKDNVHTQKIGEQHEDDGWRFSMPSDDPGLEIIYNDPQLSVAWRAYRRFVTIKEEALSPSEFLTKVNSVTDLQLSKLENGVSSAQEQGIKDYYAMAAPITSLWERSPERQIELYNRLFAANLISHDPVLDINIGLNSYMAKYDSEKNILVYTKGGFKQINEFDYGKISHLVVDN